jgi:hypothetical protein
VAANDRFGSKGAAKKVPQEASRPTFFNRKRQAVDYDWGSFANPYFAAALGCLAAQGSAVMVGGAIGGRGAMLTIYSNKDKDRTFVATPEELLDWCHDVLEYFGSPSEDIYMSYGLEPRGDA